ncbi:MULTISPECIES: hypothetical protein [Natrialbaceae]|uniref:hypothetical protein n=1 Tax=Natrialbaceae TaxID=1644061 RepID=UPI00207D6A74|nr:hypothetical protein [Natronococcus sp. CG52]
MGTTIDDATYTDAELEREDAGERRSTLATARLGAFYLPLLLAGVMSVLFLPDLLATLVTGWTADGAAELGIHRLHVMGIATVVTVFLLGLFAQAYQPKKRVASVWGAFLVILAVTAGTVGYGVGRPEEVVPFFVVTGLALVAHPAGRTLLRRGDSYSPALLALVAVAAVPLLAFVATQLSLSSSTIDPHALDGHYVMMAGLAIAPLAYGIVAALGFDGWRLASWLAALPMAYYGLLSISFTTQTGSTGVMWGAAAILWAIAFVAVAEYSRMGGSAVLRRGIERSG